MRHASEPCWHTLRFDGSCSGNGSDDSVGRWSFHLTDASGCTVGLRTGASAVRAVTSNITEYEGLLNGLRHAAGVPGLQGLLVQGDSLLVVNQVLGRWSARASHLAELWDESLALLDGLGVPWRIEWIPREENEFCDAMT